MIAWSGCDRDRDRWSLVIADRWSHWSQLIAWSVWSWSVCDRCDRILPLFEKPTSLAANQCDRAGRVRCLFLLTWCWNGYFLPDSVILCDRPCDQLWSLLWSFPLRVLLQGGCRSRCNLSQPSHQKVCVIGLIAGDLAELAYGICKHLWDLCVGCTPRKWTLPRWSAWSQFARRKKCK